MSGQQNSYRQIMKATSIFGGVQMINILIGIIRSKVIAVLLGPTGMGISGLLTATTGMISQLTNFGLGTSAVKNVAEANVTGDNQRIITIVTVLRRWVWITGLLGALVTLSFSYWLSQVTFGNHHYTLAFIWLSITFIFNQISSGQLVILQGMRKLKYLANANLIGSLIGLLVSLPFYYFWKIDGIVPAIIVSSIMTMLLSWYFAGKIKIAKVRVDRQTTLALGKNMLKMGFMLSLSSLITLGVSYLLRIYINHRGGVEEVGLYNAGFAIINSYVGMIFTAMATDFYPRLSAVADNNEKCTRTINQQAEIAILILAPILLIFLTFIDWVVVILYSKQFLAINGMIYWATLGMFFKAASWAIGFILLAKGASKIFFWSEVISNLYMLLLNVAGYHFLGLKGLGIAFLLTYILALIQLLIIAKIKYDFQYKTEFIKIFITQLIFATFCFISVIFLRPSYSYIVGGILIIGSGVFSFIEMDKRIHINSSLKTFINKTTM